MAMTAPLPPLRFGNAVDVLAPSSGEPARKVYRVGTPYIYRDVRESLASATCAWLTAHYRLLHKQVARFDQFALANLLMTERDQWEALPGYLVNLPPPLGQQESFNPLMVLWARSAEELARAVVEAGPTILWMAWPEDVYDQTSRAYGEEWVGPDGTELRGPPNAPWWRGVLVKGVSYRFRAFRLQDEFSGGPPAERWMPFSEVARAFSGGTAKALTGIFDS